MWGQVDNAPTHQERDVGRQHQRTMAPAVIGLLVAGGAGLFAYRTMGVPESSSVPQHGDFLVAEIPAPTPGLEALPEPALSNLGGTGFADAAGPSLLAKVSATSSAAPVTISSPEDRFLASKRIRSISRGSALLAESFNAVEITPPLPRVAKSTGIATQEFGVQRSVSAKKLVASSGSLANIAPSSHTDVAEIPPVLTSELKASEFSRPGELSPTEIEKTASTALPTGSPLAELPEPSSQSGPSANFAQVPQDGVLEISNGLTSEHKAFESSRLGESPISVGEEAADPLMRTDGPVAESSQSSFDLGSKDASSPAEQLGSAQIGKVLGSANLTPEESTRIDEMLDHITERARQPASLAPKAQGVSALTVVIEQQAGSPSFAASPPITSGAGKAAAAFQQHYAMISLNGQGFAAIPLRASSDQVSLHLGTFLSLFKSSMAAEQYARLSSAQAADQYIRLETMRAAGIDITYDAKRDVLNLASP